MKLPRWVIALALLLLVLVVGCSAKTPKSQTITTEASSGQRAAEAPRVAPVAGAATDTGARSDLGSATEQLIIRTVNLTMTVEDTEKTLEELQGLLRGYNGYIAELNKWFVNDQPYAKVTVRVPSASLDEALGLIRKMALRVDSETSSAQDVTEEYVDLQARLRNLEATEKELLALMTEVRENRGKAEEILAIYRELTQIRAQIESLKGRQQYLERMTALATVQMEIRPKAAPQPVTGRTLWNPLVTASNAARGLVSALRFLADLLIYVVILSPIFLIPLAVLWLLVRLLRRKARKSGPEAKQ